MTKSLYVVNILRASIVSGSRVSLSILIVENTSDSSEAGVRTIVLRGDEVDTVDLSLLFVENLLIDFRVRLLNGPSEL